MNCPETEFIFGLTAIPSIDSLKSLESQSPNTTRLRTSASKMPKVHLLDYVAGNVRSLVNAIEKVGYEVEWIRSPEDVKNAEVRTDKPARQNALRS